MWRRAMDFAADVAWRDGLGRVPAASTEDT